MVYRNCEMEVKGSFAQPESSGIFAAALNTDNLDSECLDHSENERDEKFWSENKVELRNMLNLKYDYICEPDPLSCISKTEPEDRLKSEHELGEESCRKKPPFACTVCNCKFWKRKFFVKHCSKHRKIIDSKKDCREVKTTNIIRMTRLSKSTHSTMCNDNIKTFSGRRVKDEQTRSSRYPRRSADGFSVYDDRGKFQCPYCPYSSKKNKDVKSHELVHRGDTPFICDICPCSFNSGRSFKFHVSRFHPEFMVNGVVTNLTFREPQVKEETSNGIATRSRSSDRIAVSGSRTSSECNDLLCCRFSPFKCKNDLPGVKNGQKVVTRQSRSVSEKPLITKRPVTIVYANELTCSYCPLFFRSLSARKRHEWIHTGEMPYTCEFCDASFRIKAKHRLHRMKCRLTKSETFSCKHCDAKFKFVTMLSRHCKKAHRTRKAREPPAKVVTFPCNSCEASFKIQSMLEVHKRKAHRAQKAERKTSNEKRPEKREPTKCLEKELRQRKTVIVPRIAESNFQRIIVNDPRVPSWPEEAISGVQNGESQKKTVWLMPRSCFQKVIVSGPSEVGSCQEKTIMTGMKEAEQYFKQPDTVSGPSLYNEQFVDPESLMIKEEFIELPEHVVEHDRKLWSEFIVIDDDD